MGNAHFEAMTIGVNMAARKTELLQALARRQVRRLNGTRGNPRLPNRPDTVPDRRTIPAAGHGQ